MHVKLPGVIILLAALFCMVSVSSAEKVDGTYETLPGIAGNYDGKEVEVIEFLSFYCGHCYQFEKAIPVIKGNFPKKIRWKTVPIFWGKGSPKPGEAYFLAVEAGKGEAMKREIFHAIFVDKKDIGNVDVLEELAVKVGLGFDFSRRLRAGDKAREAGEAILMSQTYAVNETPSLVIAGNLKTSPGMFQGDTDALKNNVITMIRGILGK